MKQSLEASKQGHALKRAQAEAERARVLEVIRSSNANAHSGEHRERERERGRSAGSAGGSRSPTKGLGVGVGLGTHGQGHVGTGAGHRRPVPSPPRSAVSSVFSASSAGSFDQVASARLGLGTHTQRRFGSPDADRFSSVSGVSGVSGVSSGSASMSSGSSQAKPSRQAGQQQQQIPYSAPPTHPDRRAGAGAGGSTTPRHALTQAQAHRRSPSYQSTTSTSAYTSRSQPSRSSPTGDRGGDDGSREEGEGDGEGVWPWNGNGPGSGNTSGKRTRPTRSQSMHQQSSPTTSTSTSTSGPFSPSLSSGALGRVSPPLPPPRRKTRPESVQLPNQSSTSTPTRRGSAFGGDDAAVGSPFANAFESSSGSGAGSLFDRDRDKDRERDKDKNTAAMPLSLSALQRSLSTLHARAQPVLDRARYKAEAGLSRRGFVPHAHAHNRLFEDERGEEEGVGHLVAHGTGGTAESEDTLGSVESMGDGGTELGVDRGMGGMGGMDGGGPGWESDGSERGGRGRTGSGYAFGRERERDSLKLPVEGEGWRPL